MQRGFYSGVEHRTQILNGNLALKVVFAFQNVNKTMVHDFFKSSEMNITGTLPSDKLPSIFLTASCLS
jgi:hypothetical protein